MYGDNPRNFKTGIRLQDLDMFTQEWCSHLTPTHWKAVWKDRRGHQERLYNKLGAAKAQRTRLKAYNIDVQVVPCLLVELPAIDFSEEDKNNVEPI